MSRKSSQITYLMKNPHLGYRKHSRNPTGNGQRTGRDVHGKGAEDKPARCPASPSTREAQRKAMGSHHALIKPASVEQNNTACWRRCGRHCSVPGRAHGTAPTELLAVSLKPSHMLLLCLSNHAPEHSSHRNQNTSNTKPAQRCSKWFIHRTQLEAAGALGPESG